MKAQQIDETIGGSQFEDVPTLQDGEKLTIVSAVEQITPTNKYRGVLITCKDGSKRFSTASTVVGQLLGDWYQNLIAKAVEKGDGLEARAVTKEANTGRPMLALTVF